MDIYICIYIFICEATQAPLTKLKRNFFPGSGSEQSFTAYLGWQAPFPTMLAFGMPDSTPPHWVMFTVRVRLTHSKCRAGYFSYSKIFLSLAQSLSAKKLKPQGELTLLELVKKRESSRLWGTCLHSQCSFLTLALLRCSVGPHPCMPALGV